MSTVRLVLLPPWSDSVSLVVAVNAEALLNAWDIYIGSGKTRYSRESWKDTWAKGRVGDERTQPFLCMHRLTAATATCREHTQDDGAFNTPHGGSRALGSTSILRSDWQLALWVFHGISLFFSAIPTGKSLMLQPLSPKPPSVNSGVSKTRHKAGGYLLRGSVWGIIKIHYTHDSQRKSLFKGKNSISVPSLLRCLLNCTSENTSNVLHH